MKRSYFTKSQKEKAKRNHKLSKLNNPVLFNENRETLATILIESLTERTPRWGSLRVRYAKSI